MSHLKIVNY